MNNNPITIKIRMSTAATFTIGADSETITSASTIRVVKDIISHHEQSGNCSIERQRLIHKGRILSDDSRTLGEYGILDSEQTIHLVKGSANPVNKQSAQATVSSNHAILNTTATTSMTATPSSNRMNNPRSNNINSSLDQMLMGAFNNNTTMPDIAQIQEQVLNNPEMLEQMTNNPFFQSMMNNPDLIRNSMESNPQMRQLLETNPELRQVLDDPEMMRRSMELMRNPAAMRNMMRNQDLALSQIENIPGGFNALRRMYEDVQEPLMDALSNTRISSTSQPSRPTSENAGSGAAGSAMPNPWGRSRTAASTTGVSSSSSVSQNSLGGTNSNTFGLNTNPWANVGQSNQNTTSGLDMNNTGLNIEQSIQMLENPFVQQMMEQFMQNPALMQQMIESNPMIRQLRETNPQMAAMMSNPEMMRTMMNPNHLRSMLSLQNSMQQRAQSIPGFPAGGGLGGSSSATTNDGRMDFSAILNQMQHNNIGGQFLNQHPISPEQPIPPEQRYRIQLQSLNDMGFDDNVSNIAALVRTHGNVNQSIDILLSSPPSTNQLSSNDILPPSDSGTNKNPDSFSEKDKDM